MAMRVPGRRGVVVGGVIVMGAATAVFATLLGLAAIPPLGSAAAEEAAAGGEATLAAQARGLVSAFSGRLRADLTQAMKTSGPVGAIEVCSTAAPAIAREASADGWTVGRTALRLRNAGNAPDAWEKRTLAFFEAEKARGADLAALEKFETMETDGVRRFRYMKAIVTAEPCLACHGESLAGPVKARLEALYPNDQAVGFKAGDLRGAFTLSRVVK